MRHVTAREQYEALLKAQALYRKGMAEILERLIKGRYRLPEVR